MATKTPTYDDITRSTVPDPDGSTRPSKEQVEKAYDGTHTRTADDQKLLAAVQASVQSHRDGAYVTALARDGQVDLRGRVSSASSITELEDSVRTIPGVSDVTNKLVVGS